MNSAVDTLFLLTAGLLAAVGTVLFVIGLIKRTPLKYVFIVIFILGIIGKVLLPHDVYKQAKKEGIIWLTVLHGGNIEAARAEHQEGTDAINDLINSPCTRKEEIPYFVNED